MRRREKEIQNSDGIARVIEQCQVVRLGMARDNKPYVVPLSFGFDGSAIYFHCAREGKKLEYLAANNQVCIEFDHAAELTPHDEKPCKWGCKYQSVIGFGTAEELIDDIDKIHGLNQIMLKYSGKEWAYDEAALHAVKIWKVSIESMTGKQA